MDSWDAQLTILVLLFNVSSIKYLFLSQLISVYSPLSHSGSCWWWLGFKHPDQPSFDCTHLFSFFVFCFFEIYSFGWFSIFYPQILVYQTLFLKECDSFLSESSSLLVWSSRKLLMSKRTLGGWSVDVALLLLTVHLTWGNLLNSWGLGFLIYKMRGLEKINIQGFSIYEILFPPPIFRLKYTWLCFIFWAFPL